MKKWHSYLLFALGIILVFWIGFYFGRGENGISNLETQEDVPAEKDQLETFLKYYNIKRQAPSSRSISSDFQKITTVPEILLPCPEAAISEEGCFGRSDFYLYAQNNWETSSSHNWQKFYLGEDSQIGPIFYGPFWGDLKELVQEIQQVQR